MTASPAAPSSGADLAALLGERRAKGRTIGFVPTMGALHDGHLSLIARAAEENDDVVVSVFVNPAQFGPGEDFEKYPRDFERDRRLAGDAGATILFHPGADEIYPAGHRTYIEVEGLSDVLCGEKRKGHFRGVATVVWKLLTLVDPRAAYFGAKDAQQLVVIRAMVRDLCGPWKIVAVPTVREADGLALSSRNAYLSPEERRAAPALFGALTAARRAAEEGERAANRLVKIMEGVLAAAGPTVVCEYACCVDLSTLGPVKEATGDLILAVAANVGGARLIDNICLRIGEKVEEILP